MSVDIPTPIDTHVDDVTKAGTFGSPTNIGDKANGGLPLNTKGTQWYGKTTTGGAGLYWDFSATQNFSTNEKIYIIASTIKKYYIITFTEHTSKSSLCSI